LSTRSILAFAAFACATQGHAEGISRSSLLQYQYQPDTIECNVTLSDGTKIEFGGVFANENNETVAHELNIFRIRTVKEYRFSSVVSFTLYGESWDAKVVKVDAEHAYFAVDSLFLNALWGSDEPIAIHQVGTSTLAATDYFSIANEPEKSRLALSRGKTCREEALNSD
jgi:hypothetical protein